MPTKPIVTDETFEESMKKVTRELHNISLGVGGNHKKPNEQPADPDNPAAIWEDLVTLCRTGQVTQVVEVGDIYNIPIKGKDTQFAVMGFITPETGGSIRFKNENLNTGVIFQSLNLIKSIQFDEKEAFYYVGKDGLAQGTYNFTIKNHPWVPEHSGKTFQFTLDTNLPAGAQLIFEATYNANLIDTYIKVCANGESNSNITSAIISYGSEGTSIGTIDISIRDKMNSIYRIFFGNNRWKHSALRQYLNSNNVAAEVWSQQHEWDRYPNWSGNQEGFLREFDPIALPFVQEVLVDTYKNTMCDGGGIDTTEELFFLPSTSEVFFPIEADDNGAPWDFYKIGSQFEEPSASPDPIRIKTNTSGTPYYWWLRAPTPSLSSYVYIVHPTGERSSSNAYSGLGLAPAFVIG